MSMRKLVESIFDYKNNTGSNCMLISFQMMVKYCNETRKYPDSSMPMFNEIESSILYLIELAENNKLEMDKIVNFTSNIGDTLFQNATFYSESLAIELLNRNVDVRTLDYYFQIPTFKVS